MPGVGFLRRQFGSAQRLSQVPARADLFPIRHQPGNGRAVLEKDESDVLIMGSVDAIGKIARGIRDADGYLSHNIGLSDFQRGVSSDPDLDVLDRLDRFLLATNRLAGSGHRPLWASTHSCHQG